jgi:hypothetical protein
MELEAHDKTRTTLQFGPDELDRFLARAIQTIADARNQKHAKAGHPGFPVLMTVAVGSAPAVGGSHVLVYLKTNNGTEHHFGVPTNGAEQLAGHIATAVAEARRQSSQTRQ